MEGAQSIGAWGQRHLCCNLKGFMSQFTILLLKYYEGGNYFLAPASLYCSFFTTTGHKLKAVFKMYFKAIHLIHTYFWLRQELKESQCSSIRPFVRPFVRPFSSSLSRAVNLHLSWSESTKRALKSEDSASILRAIRALKSESHPSEP